MGGTAEGFFDEIVALKKGMRAAGMDVTFREVSRVVRPYSRGGAEELGRREGRERKRGGAVEEKQAR